MIEMKQLCFTYIGTKNAILNDISIDIEDGEYISIIGDNGCGKTTLMRIILGFLKPTRGSILVNTKRIGYVPQKKEVMSNFPITVFESLNSYRKLLKIKDKEVIMNSLKLVGMEKYKNNLIGTLSGGQTQKIMLARAMMGEPKLLILDEPSTGVDYNSQIEIYKIIKDMNQNEKITVIAVEHNLDAVYSNSTKIFHMKDGRGHLCNIDNYAKEYLERKERTDYYASV